MYVYLCMYHTIVLFKQANIANKTCTSQQIFLVFNAFSIDSPVSFNPIYEHNNDIKMLRDIQLGDFSALYRSMDMVSCKSFQWLT